MRDILFTSDVIKDGDVGLELGVWKGDFSKQILNSKNIQHLTLVDPWLHTDLYPDRWYGKASQNEMEAIYENVKETYKDNPKVLVIRGTREDIPKKEYDWIYIDGDHSEEPVYQDLVTCWPLIKRCLILDDYYLYTVRKAVKRFTDEMSIEKIYLRNGQLIIPKGELKM